MNTVPNQNIVIIKKTPCKENFLQIKNEEWMQAAKDCGVALAPFKLYLYLAANEIDYEKALSPVAVEKAVGIKRSNYYNVINKLKDLGYLVDIGGNKFEFYTSPVHSNGQVEKKQKSTLVDNKKNDLKSTGMDSGVIVHSNGLEEKNQQSTLMDTEEKIPNTYGF